MSLLIEEIGKTHKKLIRLGYIEEKTSTIYYLGSIIEETNESHIKIISPDCIEDIAHIKNIVLGSVIDKANIKSIVLVSVINKAHFTNWVSLE